jgi:hypothetical protein
MLEKQEIDIGEKWDLCYAIRMDWKCGQLLVQKKKGFLKKLSESNMFRELLAWSLILFGIIEIGNFFAHHESNTPFGDYKRHALAGLIMCVSGAVLLKTKLSFDYWSKIK